MKLRDLIFGTSYFALILLSACVKNATPNTIYDTVITTKTDTVQLPPPPIDTPNVTSGLVLYLPFTNGSMADSSGGGNTVSARGQGALGYDMHGYAQSAFTGDGNGSYLMVSNNGNYVLDTAFSISLDFMVRTESVFHGVGVPGLETLISLVDTLNGNGPTFHIGMVLTNEENLEVSISPSTNGCDNIGSGSQNLYDTTNFIPQPGAWYNMIVTFSSGSYNTYINGQLISSKTAPFNAVDYCDAANLVIGGWWHGDPESINGEIDEVRLYNRGLTTQQVGWLSRNFQIHSNSQSRGLKGGHASTIH